MLPIYQVDAFCESLFSGNPAAICPLASWLPDALMQNIAAENNLAETAFYVREKDHFHIRWFTPAIEVDLCGHATLAAAHVLLTHEGYTGNTIVFDSRSGELKVTRDQPRSTDDPDRLSPAPDHLTQAPDRLTLDFPADTLQPVAITAAMRRWFPTQPIEAYKGNSDYMLVFSAEADIANMIPDLAAIKNVTEARGIIVTAKGDSVDFVSRFFAPQSGIDEDPATGSAHTTLTPYWAEKLGKQQLTALQLSPRKGYLQCTAAGNRVMISGKAKTYLIGQLLIK
jgi:PhzF family phenazine biosynthesis protein